MRDLTIDEIKNVSGGDRDCNATVECKTNVQTGETECSVKVTCNF